MAGEHIEIKPVRPDDEGQACSLSGLERAAQIALCLYVLPVLLLVFVASLLAAALEFGIGLVRGSSSRGVTGSSDLALAEPAAAARHNRVGPRILSNSNKTKHARTPHQCAGSTASKLEAISQVRG